MRDANISFNAATYQHIITQLCGSQNLEMALFRLHEMQSIHGLEPTLKTGEHVIGLAAHLRESRLALDLIGRVEKSSIRQIQSWTLVDALACFARDCFVSSAHEPNKVKTPEIAHAT